MKFLRFYWFVLLLLILVACSKETETVNENLSGVDSQSEEKVVVYDNGETLSIGREEFKSKFNETAILLDSGFLINDITELNKGNNLVFNLVNKNSVDGDINYILTSKNNPKDDKLMNVVLAESDIDATDEKYDSTETSKLMNIIYDVFLSSNSTKKDSEKPLIEDKELIFKEGSYEDFIEHTGLFNNNVTDRKEIWEGYTLTNNDIFLERSKHGVLFAVHPLGTFNK